SRSAYPVQLPPNRAATGQPHADARHGVISGGPLMPNRHADRNLLFGILALQMDFISRDALLAAMNAWVLDKTKPLGQILQDQGPLLADNRPLLDALVQRHLEMRGDDPQRSLAALNSADPARDALGHLADADVQASMARQPHAQRGAGQPGVQ